VQLLLDGVYSFWRVWLCYYDYEGGYDLCFFSLAVRFPENMGAYIMIYREIILGFKKERIMMVIVAAHTNFIIIHNKGYDTSVLFLVIYS